MVTHKKRAFTACGNTQEEGIYCVFYWPVVPLSVVPLSVVPLSAVPLSVVPVSDILLFCSCTTLVGEYMDLLWWLRRSRLVCVYGTGYLHVSPIPRSEPSMCQDVEVCQYVYDLCAVWDEYSHTYWLIAIRLYMKCSTIFTCWSIILLSNWIHRLTQNVRQHGPLRWRDQHECTNEWWLVY